MFSRDVHVRLNLSCNHLSRTVYLKANIQVKGSRPIVEAGIELDVLVEDLVYELDGARTTLRPVSINVLGGGPLLLGYGGSQLLHRITLGPAGSAIAPLILQHQDRSARRSNNRNALNFGNVHRSAIQIPINRNPVPSRAKKRPSGMHQHLVTDGYGSVGG